MMEDVNNVLMELTVQHLEPLNVLLVVVVKKPPLIELPANSALQVNTPTEANANSAQSTPSPLKLVLVNVLLAVLELKPTPLKLDVNLVFLDSIPLMMDLVSLAPLVLSVLLLVHLFVVNVDVVDNPLLIELTVSYVLLVNSQLNLELVKLVNKTNIHPTLVPAAAALVELV